jgi:hypothetical protein
MLDIFLASMPGEPGFKRNGSFNASMNVFEEDALLKTRLPSG